MGNNLEKKIMKLEDVKNPARYYVGKIVPRLDS